MSILSVSKFSNLKKIACGLLASIMIIGMCPVAVFADQDIPIDDEISTPTNGDNLYIANKDVTNEDVINENDVNNATGTDVVASKYGQIRVSAASTTSEKWELNVPAELSPGESGVVTLSGMWPANRTINITCGSNVVLTSNIDRNDTISVGITFSGLSLKGSNSANVSGTSNIAVANVDASTLFGSWDGSIKYYIGSKDSPEDTDVYNVTSEQLASMKLYFDGNGGIASLYSNTLSNDDKITYENLVIPDSVDNVPVTSIIKKGFNNCTSLQNVVMPNSISSIGMLAFARCSNLRTITLSKSITSIPSRAFYNCIELRQITIPEGVVQIDAAAFQNCNLSSGVYFPSTLTSIGAGAFAGTGMKSLDFSNILNDFNLGDGAFMRCENLETIKFSNKISLINNYAFSGCVGLVNLDIPDSITGIGSAAFANCTSLANIRIGSGIKDIFNNPQGVSTIPGMSGMPASAFFGCTSLESIVINKNQNDVSGSPWGATNATVSWTGGDDLADNN